MRVNGLEWDDINLEHIGKHNLSPEEIEDACFGRHYAFRVKYKRMAIFGQTSGGKYIKVILEQRHGNTYRPITAFGMKREEQKKYKSIMGSGVKINGK
ncbi:MAG: hypothetical protein E3J40_03010 [Dehalococcoidia bacterium]|nr:MAG: hypothetical protein E3J40_03010 [Dehalococcoidia bacterium]